MELKKANKFRITSICLAVLFVALISATLTHAETYTFVTKWGNDSGQFFPEAIAIDSSGNVFVLDGCSIQKFDSNGNLIKRWGSNGYSDGQFMSPTSISVDSSGNVYVVDWRYIVGYPNCRISCSIEKFDNNGNYLMRYNDEANGDAQYIGEFRCLALDSSGYFYLGDSKNNCIKKFDSSGNFIKKWGSQGSGNGQFKFPVGIAVDSIGNVYVADQDNNRVQKFDSSGNLITKWGSYGSGDGQFNAPEGIAIDSLDNVFVIDFNERIQKFDSKGNFITKWGSQGNGDGQFYNPRGIAIDPLGYVYAVDVGNYCIQKFAKVGKDTPTLTWSNPADINYGTALSNTQLNAVASVPGNFIYTPPSGTVLSEGMHTLHVDFTPNDTTNYDTASKEVTINVKSVSQKPVAGFFASPTTGYAPIEVNFTDQSTGKPSSWSWKFGDGTTSTAQNPQHTYNKAEKYTVILSVKNAAGSNIMTKYNYIVVTVPPLPPKPVAEFTASPTSGKASLTVQFTDASTNKPTSWSWKFGDGSISTLKNPSHKYTKRGAYTVSLTVKNASGSSSVTKSKYITVK